MPLSPAERLESGRHRAVFSHAKAPGSHAWTGMERAPNVFAKRFAKRDAQHRPSPAMFPPKQEVQITTQQILKRFGRIDILFNNAGIVAGGRDSRNGDGDVGSLFRHQRAKHVSVCRAVIPGFLEQGGGVILNASSCTALRSVPDRSAYSATKSAVLSMTRSMAIDYAAANIRVNCLCPGTVDTPSLHERLGNSPEMWKKFVARQPLGRLGKAEEIAQAALYLVSDEAGYMTGTAFKSMGACRSEYGIGFCSLERTGSCCTVQRGDRDHCAGGRRSFGGTMASLPEVARNCNALWEAPWATADPSSRQFAELSDEYGGSPAGRFLAAFTGHALCLDYFGPPAKEDEVFGAALHGEAATRTWRITPTNAWLQDGVDLPRANLYLSRSISLPERGSSLLIEEQVENRSSSPRGIHWVQHLTLGPPLLEPGEAFVQASVDNCLSWPLGYEGNAVLPDSIDFAWPKAPTLDGSGIDLRNPFEQQGKGFVVAARVSQTSPLAFVAAANVRIGIMLLYCFRRERIFHGSPSGRKNACRWCSSGRGSLGRGGWSSAPPPCRSGQEVIRNMGSLFDTPVERILPAGGRYRARYAICLATFAADVRALQQVAVDEDAFTLSFSDGTPDLEVAAPEVGRFLG